MRVGSSVLVSAVWFVAAPGMVAGVLPWWLAGWRVSGEGVPLVWRLLGGALIALGAAVLLHAFVRFVLEGRGSPAPVAAPRRLVVGGLYRYVRNPMYLAVFTVIFGDALVLAHPGLLWYLGAVIVASAAFVHGYEEPTLRARFGDDFDRYRREVPAWLPRPRGRRYRGA